tara:strand:- start:34 stop:363 length:330 start_codon:yes stop_codon:yes gene_type:complete
VRCFRWASKQPGRKGAPESLSSENILYHSSVHISEAELSSLIAKGKTLMVNAQLMEDGRIEIVNVNGVTSDGIPKIISFSVDVAPLAAAPGHPYTVSVLMMIAASLGFS